MALELTEEQKAAGWQVMKLGDLCKSIDYGLTASATEKNTGTKFLRITDIKSGYCDDSSVPFVELSDDERRKYLLHAGDIVIARTGATTGISAWLKNPQNTVFASYLVRFAVKDGEHNSRFIGYLLKTDIFQRYIYSVLAEKSAQPNASATTIANAELPVPSRGKQDRIAEILGSVDDKIEANSRLLKSLYRLLHEVYEFELSQGSYEVLLTEIAEFVNGKAFTKNATGTGRMVVRIAELNSGPGASTVYNDLPEVEPKYLVNPGEVLMSWSGSLGVYLWPREQAIVNQHIFKVIPKPGHSLGTIYCVLQSVIENFQAIAQDKATTMGHIKRGDLERPILVPADTGELENIFSLISLIEQENISLINTRDLLIRYLIG